MLLRQHACLIVFVLYGRFNASSKHEGESELVRHLPLIRVWDFEVGGEPGPKFCANL
jgi:hypothetical protein